LTHLEGRWTVAIDAFEGHPQNYFKQDFIPVCANLDFPKIFNNDHIAEYSSLYWGEDHHHQHHDDLEETRVHFDRKYPYFWTVEGEHGHENSYVFLNYDHHENS